VFTITEMRIYNNPLEQDREFDTMPKYKNQFVSQAYFDHEIQDENGSKIGTLRVKPVGLAWKGRGKQSFLAVDLQKFVDWISEPGTKARKTGS
jgi:hypothetical protein